jgi:hypothetical protein
MNFKLKVILADTSDYSDLGRRFRFAILDTDKASDYPANFVCLLPSNFSGGDKNVFFRIFGDKSKEQALLFLNEALGEEQDATIKAEIQRRLKVLAKSP